MQFVNFVHHPALQDLISTSGVMYADFEQSGISTIYEFPWSAQIRINFTVQGLPLKIRKETNGQLLVLPECSVIGPQMGRNTVYFDSRSVMISLCFHPGAFYRLTRVPVYELVDRDLDAAHLFGKGIWQLQRQLQGMMDAGMMKAVIDDFFLRRIGQIAVTLQPFDSAIGRWIDNNGNLPVQEVAADACMSVRQFERKCNERLGVPPKLFARLVRFARAHAMAERMMGSWTDIAYNCGYYDQTHFIRDFKEFAGVTPGILADESSQSLKLIYFLETAPAAHAYTQEPAVAEEGAEILLRV